MKIVPEIMRVFNRVRRHLTERRSVNRPANMAVLMAYHRTAVETALALEKWRREIDADRPWFERQAIGTFGHLNRHE